LASSKEATQLQSICLKIRPAEFIQSRLSIQKEPAAREGLSLHIDEFYFTST